jgi:uncharacterized ferritin-like protein (DUF455 family)
VNVHDEARAVLAEPSVAAKLAGAERLWQAWQAGRLDAGPLTEAQPLLDAGRPARPVLAPARAMPRRDLNTPEGHAALIHALAHIEFNAINLALDAVYRFQALPAAYYGDWLRVAAEEAYHFRLLRDHLVSLGHDYGDFPAHGGLWEMARRTARDPLRRMALVPRLLEARGLDVTPDIQRRLRSHGDRAGADILDIILRDEIGHVAAGDRWFRHLCAARGLPVAATFRALLEAEGIPLPRRPLNEAARRQAGFEPEELADLLAD